jgi:hypothetical protein
VVDIGDIGVGARVLGLGKASVGGIDDAAAIFTNPAALTLNQNLNLTSMSGSLLGDIKYLMVGASDNIPFGRFGVGYLNASVVGIPITVVTGTGSSAAVSWEGNTDYGSSIVFFTYGTKLGRIFRGRFDNISLGASLKYFIQGFSGGGTALQDAVGNGMDVDVGLTAQTANWARLGLTFNNCLPSSLGGKFRWTKNSAEESIPLAIRAGGFFNLIGQDAIGQSEKQRLDMSLEYETGRGSNRPAVWHTGFEYSPMTLIAIRAGIDQKPKATDTGTGIDNNFTAGLGLKFAGFTFDYAYHQYGDISENTTHFFSLGYVGLDKKTGKKKEEANKQVVPKVEVAPKPKVVAFSDVGDDYWAKRPIEYVATLGIMGGYPDQTFKPAKPLTRGELAAILVKAKGFETAGQAKEIFRDVKQSSWVAPYVAVAVAHDYISGYPDGSFQPDKKITRAEAAVVMAKFSGLFVKPKVVQNVYPDVKKNHWAAPAIAADKDAGLFEYLAGKDFDPGNYLTRAEVAEILSKTPTVKDKIKDFISGE